MMTSLFRTWTLLIGEAIKQARKEKNLTQEQLGVLMGVQRSQVSRIERGHNLTNVLAQRGVGPK